MVTFRDGHLGRASPRYLTARDEVWVRDVIDRFDAYVGRSVRQRENELPDKVRLVARQHGVSVRAADGVAHVLERRFETKIDTRLDPKIVRSIVFEEAGREDTYERTAALDRAALRLEAPISDVVRAVFADRRSARCIISPAVPPGASEIVDSYNLALVQGLLLRSEHVMVDVREHVRAVVRFAKLAGLLCTVSLGEDGTRIEVSGPLSILRHTTKYGFALAAFFPSVVATTRYCLEAQCVLRGEPVTIAIDATDRIARTHKLPRDADSAVERALARDIRRLGGPWTLVREADAVVVGKRLFFPDFTLRHSDGFAALVEVVGFYTPEYLRTKLEVLRAASSRPLIVCVDESLSCSEGEVAGTVLRFKRRVDAAALLRAAEVMRTGNHRREVSPTGVGDGRFGHALENSV
jgi:predicted nuclease of restriction endonuclease-like RecB superfamily